MLNPIYGGISGAKLPVDEYDLGEGAVLRATLLTLWSALEHLFAPSKSELRFRVSALIACYLTEPGEDRMQVQKKLTKLYDERSQAAHTAEQVEGQAASDTFAIMSQVLLKIISEDRVPSREFLEKLLFGAS